MSETKEPSVSSIATYENYVKPDLTRTWVKPAPTSPRPMPAPLTPTPIAQKPDLLAAIAAKAREPVRDLQHARQRLAQIASMAVNRAS